MPTILNIVLAVIGGGGVGAILTFLIKRKEVESQTSLTNVEASLKIRDISLSEIERLERRLNEVQDELDHCRKVINRMKEELEEKDKEITKLKQQS